MKIKSTTQIAGAAALCLIAVAACSSGTGSDSSSGTTTGMDGSRSTLYTSVEDLSADSGLIVVGVVTDQTSSSDKRSDGAPESAFTVSTFEIKEAESANNPEYQDVAVPETGSTIKIRQLGSVQLDVVPAPILLVGQEYLLFLTPTGLSGDAASQFYITGGTAGYYEATSTQSARSVSPSDTFKKVGDEGDELPTSLTTDQIP